MTTMKSLKISKYLILSVLVVGFTIACDLVEQPQDVASYGDVFNDEAGLRLYTNSLYNILPSANNITQGDAMSDYGARRDVPLFLREGAYGPGTTSGWSWGQLRNVNYFLDNNTNTDIPASVRNHHNGIARFFRAMFYFEKVQRYGDVPWIDTALDIDDPKLFDGRDSREMVMDNVLADLNFAIDNLNPGVNQSRTLITRDVALALKSRIALFEGTFRKYHADGLAQGLGNTANDWLNEAVSASQELIQSGRYSVYTGSGENSYQQLFKTDSPNSAEDILVVEHDIDLDVLHSANWWYTSSTFGVRLSFIRPFINTYLNIDGTPFTNRPGYETMVFTEEVKDRDLRLQQTIRTPGYTRIDGGQIVQTPPAFSYVYTGYHPHKWTLDDVFFDGWTNNTNSVVIFRYAEILLNYAEAKAELGTLTNTDWQQTIGALRSRAGITGGTDTLPTTADPYLQSTYFPGISDPVILEVRRERGIELALEGHRFSDILRWKKGELMEMDWTGMYLPGINQYYDLNEDGTPDVYFYDVVPPSDQRTSGVIYIDVTGSDFRVTGGTSGELLWRQDIPKDWEEKKYLYPIPESDIQTNPNLGQNPGW